MTEQDLKIIERIKELLKESGNFWIQAEEQDGENVYRMTCSDSLSAGAAWHPDHGRWFSLEVIFPIESTPLPEDYWETAE